MNAANIEIGFYKTIGLMKTFFNHDEFGLNEKNLMKNKNN